VVGGDATDYRFQGLLEAAPDAIVCADAEGRIVLVNGQTERLFGYERSELIGWPVEALVPSSLRAVHPAHRATYVADPKPRPMGAGTELAGRRRDGTEFPAEMLGKEVVMRVSSLRPRVQILYMSGYAEPILTSQGTLEPGVSLIEKPFSEPQLLAKVREVLDAAKQLAAPK
jgi:PAS domain S-box-containing protein